MSAKLVAIGDSLTQGFQHGSISKTQISYPALIARCLGETVNVTFKVPDFSGADGLPVNIESILRRLDEKLAKSKIGETNLGVVLAVLNTVPQFLNEVEAYWQKELGENSSQTGPLHHNLAVWGFQLGDCDTLTEGVCQRTIPPDRPDLDPLPSFSMYRTARRTLNPSLSTEYKELNQLSAAKKIAEQEGGIDNLIFWLGGNNCLGTVGQLKIHWSEDADLYRLSHERKCNLWVPSHFQKLLDRVANKITDIGATNVFVGTVPHVTIPPISRGAPADSFKDGYFDYYTHFWIRDENFDPEKHPKLTREQARLIDTVIDEYNDAITKEANKRGWYVIDLCKVLDQLAYRRQQGHTSYYFPDGLVQALKNNFSTKERVLPNGEVLLDVRYLHVDPNATDLTKKYEGGLFGLDGIHPTTIGYGIVAYEVLEMIRKVAPEQIVNPLNWDEIIAADTLVTQTPNSLLSLRNFSHFLYGQTPLPDLIRMIAAPFMNS